MTPNQITVARVAAAFAAVALFTLFDHWIAADVAAVLLTVAAIALDGVDGYVARTRGMATPLGAQLDILGDRVVENLFFTFFAVSGLISLWVPVLFFDAGRLRIFSDRWRLARGAWDSGEMEWWRAVGDARWFRRVQAARHTRL